MPNIRNDSVKVAEAHRLADIIWTAQKSADTHPQQAIADALLDIWQFDYKDVAMPDLTTVAKLKEHLERTA